MPNDFLAGLAGGLGGLASGMAHVQDTRLQNAQQQLRQRQADLEAEQAKRRAVMEARQMLSGGMTVSPEQLQQFSQFPEFLAGIEKQDDGTFMVQKSKQEMLIEQQIAQHEREVRERQQRDQYREQVEAMGADFFNLPDAEKVAWQNKIGDPKFAIQTPEQLLQHNASLEKQRIAAQGAADAARIRASAQITAAQGRDQLTFEDAARIVMNAKNEIGQPLYVFGSPEFGKAVSALMAQGNMTASPTVNTTGIRRPSGLQRIR